MNHYHLPLLWTKLVLNTWLIVLISLSPVQSNILHNFISLSFDDDVINGLVCINALIWFSPLHIPSELINCNDDTDDVEGDDDWYAFRNNIELLNNINEMKYIEIMIENLYLL